MNENTGAGSTPSTPLVLLWGAKEIAKELGITERKTFHMLERGLIESAQKRGGCWVAEQGMLRAEFRGE